MRSLAGWGALCAGLALALVACDPDLPGRACSSHDDCFSDEICQGTSCVSGTREPGRDADDAGADAETDAESS